MKLIFSFSMNLYKNFPWHCPKDTQPYLVNFTLPYKHAVTVMTTDYLSYCNCHADYSGLFD
jgi:hypothetical protein